MNASTTDPLNLPKQITQLILNVAEEVSKEKARIIWSFVMQFLSKHWLAVMGAFVFLLVAFFIKALIGKWGSLYSLTYWTLYAIVIFIVGLIWGPEALVSDIYHVIYTLAIWPVCYAATALIWNRFDFRRKRW